MPACSVKWCGKNSSTSNYEKDNITFHRFPKNPDTKCLWIEATQRENWFPFEKSVICSRHFTKDCFIPMKNRRRLLEGAVPTQCLPSLINKPDLGFQLPSNTINTKGNSTIQPLASTSNGALYIISLNGAGLLTAMTNGVSQSTSGSIKIEENSQTTSHSTKIEKSSQSPSNSTKIRDSLQTTSVTIKVEEDSQSSSGSTKIEDSSHTPLTCPTFDKLVPETVSTDAPTPKLVKRPLSTDLDTSPSLYDTPVKKRLCRRINELTTKLVGKNKKIKALQDKNRYLKDKVASLRTSLRELEEQLLINIH